MKLDLGFRFIDPALIAAVAGADLSRFAAVVLPDLRAIAEFGRLITIPPPPVIRNGPTPQWAETTSDPDQP